MRTRSLGKTGLVVSQIGFGSWPIAGSAGIIGYGSVDSDVAKETVRAALSGGITLYDTADVYGNGFAESILGEILEPVRQDVIICTKGGWDLSRQASNLDPDFLYERIMASLRRLRSDYIDIYLLHSPPPHLIGIKDIYYPLLKMRDKGFLRHIGISVSHPDEALLVLNMPEVEIIQVPYNLLLQDAERSLFRSVDNSNVGVIVREALGNGMLTEKYDVNTQFPPDDFRAKWPSHFTVELFRQIRRLQAYKRRGESMVDLALRFVLECPQVAAVLAGARNPQQVYEHLKAGNIAALPLDDIDISRMIQIHLPSLYY